MLMVSEKHSTSARGPSNLDRHHFETDKKVYFLTFDGNGGPFNNTAEILTILEAKKAPATFFLNGRFMKKYPDTAVMLSKSGHLVGNHCLTHDRLCDAAGGATAEGLDESKFISGLKQNTDLYRQYTGAEMARVWRAPYGFRNDEILTWGADNSYVHIGWSIDTNDWRTDPEDPYATTGTEVRAQMLALAKDSPQLLVGAIILMHLGPRRALDPHIGVLGNMIDDLTLHGFRPASMADYLQGSE